MKKMTRAAVLAVSILVSACAQFGGELQSDRIAVPQLPKLSEFSGARPGDELPGGWRVWTISRFKKPTHYRLVADAGRTVVRAEADASASGLVHDVSVDPREFPVLRWRWKTSALVPGADNHESHTEDAPLRIIVAFEGDTKKLDFEDRLFYTQVRMLTGHEMPYATLMYIWAAKSPIGTVIPSRHTSRIRMVVAESGSEKTGIWREETRNIYEDYRRAFGEDPPRIKSVGIMTDTDNTGEKADSYYGDIVFLRATRSDRSEPPSE